MHAWIERASSGPEHCLGRGRGRRSKGTQEGWTGEGGKGQVFMVVEKSSGAQPQAPCPIGGPLNPGGATLQPRL